MYYILNIALTNQKKYKFINSNSKHSLGSVKKLGALAEVEAPSRGTREPNGLGITPREPDGLRL